MGVDRSRGALPIVGPPADTAASCRPPAAWSRCVAPARNPPGPTRHDRLLCIYLGLEGRERILSRMLLGTPLLVSVRMEADYIAEAWASYDDKVQLHAIQIAFDVLHHWNPNELS